MAAAAAASVPVKELDDVTECPICVEMLTDARGLPCIHTFCLKCLQGYIKNAEPGDQRPCPLCRQDFTIPEGGLAKLPRNYFVEKVLDVKKLASQLTTEDIQCDLCSEGEGGNTTGKATVFCTDCGRNMCEQCLSYHKKFRTNASHKMISLDKELRAEDLLEKFPESRCDKHSEESIKLYCYECKWAVCMMCYVEEHSSHKCSDVRKVAGELTEQLDDDIRDLQKIDVECNKTLIQMERDRKIFATRTEKSEKKICDEAEKLHRLIEKYKSETLSRLYEVKGERNKQLETIRDETKLQSVVIKNFIQYGKEVKQKGTACDIAKSVSALHRRANELRQFHPNTDYNIRIKFKGHSCPEELIPELGKLDLEDDFLTKATVRFTIANRGGSVTGLATLDDSLFVARSGRQHIEVYNTETLALEKNFQVANLGQQPQGLAACDFHRCVYISEQSTRCVHKVLWPEHTKSIRWPVGNQPCGLSINKDRNVLVACYGVNKIQEYTKDGSLVREISLHPHTLQYPMHVVQMPGVNFCISHQGPAPGVSVVDRDGKIVQQYPTEVKTATNKRARYLKQQVQILQPSGFAVDDSCQRIFVADQNGNRILVLRENDEAEPVPDSVCGPLSQPCRLHFDTGKRRLYIGEWSGARVVCCGI